MDTSTLYQTRRVNRIKRDLRKKQLPDLPDHSGGSRRDNFRDFRKFLAVEAEALLTRLGEVNAFSLKIPMAPAANIPLPAQKAIHHLLRDGVMEMKAKVLIFIRWIKGASNIKPELAQKQYALLKLKFNWLLDQVDIFADVLSQRAEHGTGIVLAGMDALAEDTLRLRGNFYERPPLITFLDRGHGAAIRRARTRLPGGKSNPVAVIRVPRERMISTGIASSLVHEVGHQGASLLELIPSLRRVLQQRARSDPQHAASWNWYERWISEILSDLWSVAMVGIGSTTGLINVVSVPSYFVFRLKPDDPHPPPWIRVRLSIAFGAAFFPDPQWDRLTRLWGELYPLELAGGDKVETYRRLEMLIPRFVQLVVDHRPDSLKGRTLKQAFPLDSRQPDQLRRLQDRWNGLPDRMLRAKPSLVFAVIGQARADGRMTPRQENQILGKMLRAWALRKIV